MYVYIYIYICVCVSVCVFAYHPREKGAQQVLTIMRFFACIYRRTDRLLWIYRDIYMCIYTYGRSTRININ